MSKQEIRSAMRKQRDRHPFGHRDSMKIWDQLEKLAIYRQARMVFAYAAFMSEVETYTIIEETKRRGKTLCLPRIRDGKEMDFFEVRGVEHLERNSRGIYEPSSREVLRVPEADTLMLIPGLAFDKKGGRIGMGSGYYDRYLHRFPQAVRVGICFDFQVLEEELPNDTLDECMQYLLTPQGVYSIEKGEWV